MTHTSVLVNCLSSRSGGALSYIRNIAKPLAAELAAQNGRLTLLLRKDQKDQVPREANLEMMIPKVGRREGWRRHLWELRNVAELVQRGDFNVYFTPYQIGVRVTGIATVAMLRNMEPFFYREYRYSTRSRLRNVMLRAETGRFLRSVDWTIAVSEFAAGVAERDLGLSRARMSVVYHGRDEGFGPESCPDDRDLLSGLGISSPYLFSCGSLLPYRRLEDVIAAYGRAELGERPLPLLIAGAGTDPRYRELIGRAIASSPKSSSIRLLGHVQPRLMQALYRHSTCVVFATEVEACPNIAIEALGSGSRIMAADVPVLREILGQGAAYYRPRDIGHLAEMLAGVCRADNVLHQKVVGLATARRYSWRTCARETAGILVRAGRESTTSHGTSLPLRC